MVANEIVKTSFFEPPLRPLLAQGSPSGLTLDCPVLGSKRPVNAVLLNAYNWKKPVCSLTINQCDGVEYKKDTLWTCCEFLLPLSILIFGLIYSKAEWMEVGV